MRIAYLINQYPKPSHTFIRREIQALERLGVDVFRISLRGWNDELVDPEDLRERVKTHYILKKRAWLALAALRVLLTRPARFLRAIALASRLALGRSERPLLVHLIYVAEACQALLWLQRAATAHVHAHFGTNSADVAMLTHVLGGPTWSMTVHGPAEFDRRPLLNLPEKIKRAAFVVAVSSFGRSQLYRCIAHQHWRKIHVVHCGLDDAFYAVTRENMRTHRLLCVGRLSEPKGQLLLLEAVKILADKGTVVELVLAGDGEMRRELEDYAAHNNIADLVRFTGWISNEQIRQEILDAAALVLPSFAEGLPVVIMEAMALRRPVISTYIAGIPELVKSGEHGWLVPAGDVGALVEVLEALLIATRETLNSVGEAARLRAIERHNIDDSAYQLREFFRATIATRELASH